MTLRIGSRIVRATRTDLHPSEAAVVLRCTAADVCKHLDRGDLKAVWIGRRRLVSLTDLVRLLADDQLALEVLALMATGELVIPLKQADELTLVGLISRVTGSQRSRSGEESRERFPVLNRRRSPSAGLLRRYADRDERSSGPVTGPGHFSNRRKDHSK